MSAALHLTEVGPLERTAHRVGTALLRWSESRAARVTTTAGPAACHRPTGGSPRPRAALRLEARHRHWDELAAATPRLR